MKASVTFFVPVIIVFCLFQPAARASEVPEGIEKLYDAGVLRGYPDGSFRGDAVVTRYEMGAVITRFYGHLLDELNAAGVEIMDFVDIRTPITCPPDMPDIPQSHWAWDEIRRLERMGLVSGYPDGQFKGTAPVDRYQFAVFLIRMVVMIDFAMWEALPSYDSGLRRSSRYNPFSYSDVPEDHWAIRDIRRLTDAGFALDSGDHTFEGDRPFTRYEMARVLIALNDRFEKELEEALQSGD